MIISRGRRYVFVHIPKTGGTSLALALEARAMKDDILIGDTPKARRRRGRLKGLSARGRLWKHATLADIDGVLGPDDLDSMLLFTLVRNPWNRAVSYYHWLRAQRFEHVAVRLAQDLPFAEFLAHPHTRASIAGHPYGSYMRDVTGAERAAVFVRLEHLAADLAPVEAHLGFPLCDLPQVNMSVRSNTYAEHYDTATRALIAEICAEDIARFGYRFQI